MDILSSGREAAWQKTKNKVLALLDKNPSGIKKEDVSRKRFTRSAQEAHDILKKIEAEGDLISREEMPKGGGPITRFYARVNV